MRYIRPRRMGYVVQDPLGDRQLVYLMLLPDGAPVVLEDSAATIWLAAAEGARNVPEAVAGRLGVPQGEIAGDVNAYLDLLVAQELLQLGDNCWAGASDPASEPP